MGSAIPTISFNLTQTRDKNGKLNNCIAMKRMIEYINFYYKFKREYVDHCDNIKLIQYFEKNKFIQDDFLQILDQYVYDFRKNNGSDFECVRLEMMQNVKLDDQNEDIDLKEMQSTKSISCYIELMEEIKCCFVDFAFDVQLRTEYIETMHAFDILITCNDYTIQVTSYRMIQSLLRHLSNVNDDDINYKNSYPNYMNQLFKRYVSNITEISMDLYIIDNYGTPPGWNHIIMDKNHDQCLLNFSYFFQIFNNCKKIVFILGPSLRPPDVWVNLSHKYFDLLLKQIDCLNIRDNHETKLLCYGYIHRYIDKKYVMDMHFPTEIILVISNMMIIRKTINKTIKLITAIYKGIKIKDSQFMKEFGDKFSDKNCQLQFDESDSSILIINI